MSSSSANKSGENCATEKNNADPRHQHRDKATGSEQQPAKQKSKRPICHRCNFPPRTCVCPSLPPEPLYPLFKHCRIIVLQHPHELRRKNRSLPLVEMCLLGKIDKKGKDDKKVIETIKERSSETDDTLAPEEDFVMKTIVGRRFDDDYTDSAIMKILRDPNEVIVLVFPHKCAMDLEEGIRLAEERCRLHGVDHKEDNQTENQRDKSTDESELATAIGPDDAVKKTTVRKKMTLMFIDATWKYAREMETKTDSLGGWPDDLIRVQMIPTAHGGKINGHEKTEEGDKIDNGNDTGNDSNNTKSNDDESKFIKRRFHIRTPPSPDHLSTAECLAWIASRVEQNPQIYQSIMKTLDYMVEIWKGFTKTADNRNNSGNGKCGGNRATGFTGGDGCIPSDWDSMSQKKRKIK